MTELERRTDRTRMADQTPDQPHFARSFLKEKWKGAGKLPKYGSDAKIRLPRSIVGSDEQGPQLVPQCAKRFAKTGHFPDNTSVATVEFRLARQPEKRCNCWHNQSLRNLADRTGRPMLQRNLNESHPTESLVWEDLTNGVPTIAALAGLCSSRIRQPREGDSPELARMPKESAAILAVAAETGSISIRGDKNAFEPGERYLAICIELDEGRRKEFRVTGNPEQTIRFMDGFRWLCQQGLVMHQLMNEFSLTSAGFDMARKVDPDSLAEMIDMGRDGV